MSCTYATRILKTAGVYCIVFVIASTLREEGCIGRDGTMAVVLRSHLNDAPWLLLRLVKGRHNLLGIVVNPACKNQTRTLSSKTNIGQAKFTEIYFKCTKQSYSVYKMRFVNDCLKSDLNQGTQVTSCVSSIESGSRLLTEISRNFSTNCAYCSDVSVNGKKDLLTVKSSCREKTVDSDSDTDDERIRPALDVVSSPAPPPLYVEMVPGKGPPPEPPVDCCMSGCANCVYIQYCEELRRYFTEGEGELRAKEAIEKIDNPGLKMFLKLELGLL